MREVTAGSSGHELLWAVRSHSLIPQQLWRSTEVQSQMYRLLAPGYFNNSTSINHHFSISMWKGYPLVSLGGLNKAVSAQPSTWLTQGLRFQLLSAHHCCSCVLSPHKPAHGHVHRSVYFLPLISFVYCHCCHPASSRYHIIPVLTLQQCPEQSPFLASSCLPLLFRKRKNKPGFIF